MSLRPIRNDQDHAEALRHVENLWGAKAGTPEGDLLEVLVDLIEHYEDRRFPLMPSDPIEMLLAHMVATDRTQSDLARLLGSAPRASEILNRKRALTVDMIRKISTEWGLPAEALIGPAQQAA
jgi:HTH-type transcriptional regulator/antitoxin HigA